MKAVFSIAWLALLLVSGCASSVQTKVNAFKAPNATLGSGTIAVTALDEAIGQSLEFAHYRTQTESVLAHLGYTPVSPNQPHSYRAVLSFGVESAQIERSGPRTAWVTRAYPYYGFHYGFGHRYGSGLGVVVVDDGIDPGYLRRLSLAIENAESGERLYEVTGFSVGRCGVMSVVFDEMLEAIVRDFPAADGSVRSVTVKGETKC